MNSTLRINGTIKIGNIVATSIQSDKSSFGDWELSSNQSTFNITYKNVPQMTLDADLPTQPST